MIKNELLINQILQTFFDKKYENPPTYASFSLDLNKINYPQQYRLLFYITDYFVIHHLYCRLVDTTNWVMIPPPQFEFSPKSNSLTLRPGESTTTEVTIKSNVDLPTQVYYASNYIEKNTNYPSIDENKKADGLALNFLPKRISLSPSGVGSSNLKITVPSDYNIENKEQSITIPISANITFPHIITNRGGESFSNSKSQSISANSNLTLTILPRYSPSDILNNFVSTWITPISGMWSFLAGVAAVMAPIIIKFYNRKKKNEQKNNSYDNGY